MDKQGVYAFLKEQGIPYEAVEHDAVYTVEEADALHLPHPEAGAKNLFLRDDKKRNYYLVTMRDHLPVSLKEIRQKIGSRPLSFANEETLMELLGLIKGAVTPFGLLNDAECRVHFRLDAYYEGKLISVHPNDNTATVYLQADDLMRLIREHGTDAEYTVLE